MNDPKNKTARTILTVFYLLFVCLPAVAAMYDCLKNIITGSLNFGHVASYVGFALWFLLLNTIRNKIKKGFDEDAAKLERGEVLCAELLCHKPVCLYRSSSRHGGSREVEDYYVEVCIEDTVYRIPTTRRTYSLSEPGTPLLVVSWDDFDKPFGWRAYLMSDITGTGVS